MTPTITESPTTIPSELGTTGAVIKTENTTTTTTNNITTEILPTVKPQSGFATGTFWILAIFVLVIGAAILGYMYMDRETKK